MLQSAQTGQMSSIRHETSLIQMLSEDIINKLSQSKSKSKVKSQKSKELGVDSPDQDKSGTLSSTDPTSYLEDKVILDKVPDV